MTASTSRNAPASLTAPTTATTSATAAPLSASLPAWDIDGPHSSVEFAVRHLMVATVTGRFRTLAGTFWLDSQRPELARVEAAIEAASIDTNEPNRDGHLRSPDFFDAAGHPQLTFRSTRVERLGEAEGRIHGDLTIRGVTRPVVLDVTHDGAIVDPDGKERHAFTAETTIHRKDFGLTWNMALETGGVLVGDKVRVTLRIQGVRRQDA